MPAKLRKMVSAQGGVSIANHCVIVNLLCIVNLLRRSIFSTAGSFGSQEWRKISQNPVAIFSCSG